MSPSWTFFVDRSLGAHLVPDALRLAGEQVEVHDDRFPQDAADEDWLPVVSRAGWLVVTKDAAIARNHLQRLLVARHGTRLFVFTSTALRGPEMAAVLAKSAGAMKKLASRNTAPFVAKIYRNGKVEIWRDHARLRAEQGFPVDRSPGARDRLR